MQEKDIDDKVAQLQQQFEQMGGAVREMANMLTLFTKTLIETGVYTEEQVTVLSITHLQSFWNHITTTAVHGTAE